MRELRMVVGVTYGEFQAWYGYGETRLCVDRLVSIEVDAVSSEPDASSPYVRILLDRLPPLPLSDEEGVLLIEIDRSRIGGRQEGADHEFLTVNVPISAVTRIIPLTNRASRILDMRLRPMGIRLERPYFHAQVSEIWSRAGVRTALRGGDALVEALFEDGLISIPDRLRQAVKAAILLKDYREEASVWSDVATCGKTWVSGAFEYTRHEAYNGGSFNYVFDAGYVLKALGERADRDIDWLDTYRQAVKELKGILGEEALLEEILSHRQFNDAAAAMENKYPSIFPVGLASLVLFLRLKERFHKLDETVDVREAAEEARCWAAVVGFDETVVAVWLVGCFAGHERIAAAVYAASSSAYPWFGGTPLRIEKIAKVEQSAEEVALVDGVVNGSSGAEPSSEASDGDRGTAAVDVGVEPNDIPAPRCEADASEGDASADTQVPPFAEDGRKALIDEGGNSATMPGAARGEAQTPIFMADAGIVPDKDGIAVGAATSSSMDLGANVVGESVGGSADDANEAPRQAELFDARVSTQAAPGVVQTPGEKPVKQPRRSKPRTRVP
jgi:hypothetical protein